jgi:hypothetical protein
MANPFKDLFKSKYTTYYSVDDLSDEQKAEIQKQFASYQANPEQYDEQYGTAITELEKRLRTPDPLLSTYESIQDDTPGRGAFEQRRTVGDKRLAVSAKAKERKKFKTSYLYGQVEDYEPKNPLTDVQSVIDQEDVKKEFESKIAQERDNKKQKYTELLGIDPYEDTGKAFHKWMTDNPDLVDIAIESFPQIKENSPRPFQDLYEIFKKSIDKGTLEQDFYNIEKPKAEKIEKEAPVQEVQSHVPTMPMSGVEFLKSLPNLDKNDRTTRAMIGDVAGGFQFNKFIKILKDYQRNPSKENELKLNEFYSQSPTVQQDMGVDVIEEKIPQFTQRKRDYSDAFRDIELVDLIPFYKDFKEAGEIGIALKYLNELQSGEELSPEKIEFLETFSEENAPTDDTTGAKIVDTMINMIPFAGEIFVSYGVGYAIKKGAKATAGKVLSENVKKEVKDALAKYTKTATAAKVTGQVTEVGLKTAGLVKVGYMDDKLALQKRLPAFEFANDGIVIQEEGMDEATANRQASAEAYIEYASEFSGPALRWITGGTFKKFRKVYKGLSKGQKEVAVSQAVANTAADYIKKQNPAIKITKDTLVKIRQWAQTAGYDGVLEEWGEERVGDATRAFLYKLSESGIIEGFDNEQYVDNVVTQLAAGEYGTAGENMVVELVSFSAPMIGIGGYSISKDAWKERVFKRDYADIAELRDEKKEKNKETQEEYLSLVEKLEKKKKLGKKDTKRLEELADDRRMSKAIEVIETIVKEKPKLKKEVDITIIDEIGEITAEQLEEEGKTMEGEGLPRDTKKARWLGKTTSPTDTTEDEEIEVNLKLGLELRSGADLDTAVEEYFGLAYRGGLNDKESDAFEEYYDRYKTDEKFRIKVNETINELIPGSVADTSQTLDEQELFEKEGKARFYESQKKPKDFIDKIFGGIKNNFNRVFGNITLDDKVRDIYEKAGARKVKIKAERAQKLEERRAKRQERQEERQAKQDAKESEETEPVNQGPRVVEIQIPKGTKSNSDIPPTSVEIGGVVYKFPKGIGRIDSLLPKKAQRLLEIREELYSVDGAYRALGEKTLGLDLNSKEYKRIQKAQEPEYKRLKELKEKLEKEQLELTEPTKIIEKEKEEAKKEEKREAKVDKKRKRLKPGVEPTLDEEFDDAEYDDIDDPELADLPEIVPPKPKEIKKRKEVAKKIKSKPRLFNFLNRRARKLARKKIETISPVAIREVKIKIEQEAPKQVMPDDPRQPLEILRDILGDEQFQDLTGIYTGPIEKIETIEPRIIETLKQKFEPLPYESLDFFDVIPEKKQEEILKEVEKKVGKETIKPIRDLKKPTKPKKKDVSYQIVSADKKENTGTFFIAGDGANLNLEGEQEDFGIRYPRTYKGWAVTKAPATKIKNQVDKGNNIIAITALTNAANAMKNNPTFVAAIERAIKEKVGVRKFNQLYRQNNKDIHKTAVAAKVNLQQLGKEVAVPDFNQIAGKIVALAEVEDIRTGDDRKVKHPAYDHEINFSKYRELKEPILLKDYIGELPEGDTRISSPFLMAKTYNLAVSNKESPTTNLFKEFLDTGDNSLFDVKTTGIQVASPQIKDIGLNDAIKEIKSKDLITFHRFVADLEVEQGLKSTTKASLGEWETGAEPSVYTEITSEIDTEQLEYIAAAKGLSRQQLTVLNFEVNKAGPDSMYEVELDVNTNNLKSYTKMLTRAGVEFKTLPVTGNKFNLVVVDVGNELVDLFKEASDVKEIKQRTGKASFIGSFESRQKADKEYLKIITEYEERYPERYSAVLRNNISNLRPRFNKNLLPKKQKAPQVSYQLTKVPSHPSLGIYGWQDPEAGIGIVGGFREQGWGIKYVVEETKDWVIVREEFNVVDLEDQTKPIAKLVLRVKKYDEKDAEIDGIIDIEVKRGGKKKGVGAKVIRGIVDSGLVASDKFKIFDIRKKALGFWEKMGVEGLVYRSTMRRELPNYNEKIPIKKRSDIARLDKQHGIAIDGYIPVKKAKPKAKVSYQLKPADQPLELPDETWREVFIRKIVNRLNRLENVTSEIGDVDEQTNAYLAAVLYEGKAEDRIDKFQNYIERYIKRLTKAGFTVDDIGEYLYARHAKERNDRVHEENPDFEGSGSGMTNEEADEILNKFKGSGIYKFAREFDKKVIRARLDILRDGGLITEETYDLFTKDSPYKNYAPLKGTSEKKGRGTGTSGFSIVGKDIRRKRGRDSRADNPFVQALIDYEMAIVRAEKNAVTSKFYLFALENPTNLWEVSGRRHIPRYDKEGEVAFFDPMTLQQNQVQAFVDGKLKVITINDEALLNAMKNLGSGTTFKFAQKFNTYLRAIYTTFNPEFLITNFERDIQTALTNIQADADIKVTAKIMKDIMGGAPMRAIYRTRREKGDAKLSVNKKKLELYRKYYAEYKKEGGAVGWVASQSVEEKLNELKKVMARAQSSRNPKQFFRYLGKWVEDMNMTVEQAVRLATYANLRESGLSKAESAKISKELTVNFNQKGEWGSFINSLYLFSNATIQGNYFWMRAFARSNKVKAVTLGMVLSTVLLNIINRMNGGDDWEKYSDYEKDFHWLYILPNGNVVKMKVPYGYNIFHVMGNVIEEVHAGKTTPSKAMSRLFNSIVHAVSPIGAGEGLSQYVPTAFGLKQVAEIWANENFMGGNIYPDQPHYQPKKPDSQLYFDSVNPSIKGITTWLNKVSGGSEKVSGKIDVSPETIEHLLTAFTGGAGKFIERSYRTGKQLLAGETPPLKEIPFVRTAVSEPSKYTMLYKMYDMLGSSARTIYTEKEIEDFNRYLRMSVEDKVITNAKAKNFKNKFIKNQKEAKASMK